MPALAATDQLRLHLDRPAVITAGKTLIAGMAGALPPVGGKPGASDAGEAGSIPRRLAGRLCAGPVPAGLEAVLNVAMVLLADHELAASTLAARVAASMRADPYAVVATGLGAMGGALHGGAALGAELMLASAESPEEVPRVVGDLLRRGERLPGFRTLCLQGRRPAGEPAAPGRPGRTRPTRRGSRWPPPWSLEESGGDPCRSRISSSPWLCSPPSRAWSAARAKPSSPSPARLAGSRTPSKSMTGTFRSVPAASTSGPIPAAVAE